MDAKHFNFLKVIVRNMSTYLNIKTIEQTATYSYSSIGQFK